MTTSRQTKGYINSIIGSTSYGTNPLFALPMYAMGYVASSVLFFRYLFASLIYFLWLKFVKKISLKITLKEAIPLFILGFMFSMSSITLFYAFNYIESGIACTILFVYPVMVAVIMAVFFKEKITLPIVGAIALTSSGILFLYSGGGTGASINLFGTVLVILSALLCAIYMVGVKTIPSVKHIRGDKQTFYVTLFGITVYILSTKFLTNLQVLNSPKAFFLALGLAVFPTIISLETINISIKFIGSTKTAIIGALEPLTATILGILLFNESISLTKLIGMLLVFGGVFVIVNTKR